MAELCLFLTFSRSLGLGRVIWSFSQVIISLSIPSVKFSLEALEPDIWKLKFRLSSFEPPDHYLRWYFHSYLY